MIFGRDNVEFYEDIIFKCCVKAMVMSVCSRQWTRYLILPMSNCNESLFWSIVSQIQQKFLIGYYLKNRINLVYMHDNIHVKHKGNTSKKDA